MISLAWTLLHFVWQGVALALLLAVANVLLRRSQAQVRYVAACATMLAMLACAIATFATLERGTPQGARMGSSPSKSLIKPRGSSLPGQIVNPTGEQPSHVLWLVYGWMIGVAVLSARSAEAWIGAQRLKRNQMWPAAQYWQERLQELSGRLALSRTVRLCESAMAEVPAVIGWLRPVILVPASAIAGLAPAQLEALLTHELAHVRRHDYLVNLIQTAIETLLFYHPAVWWVGRQIRAERENCCDDLAVSVCGDVLTYARALTHLEHLRSGTPELAMAANAGSLLARVQRLIAPPHLRRAAASDWVTPIAVLLSAIGIWAASGVGTSNRFLPAHFASFHVTTQVDVDTPRIAPIRTSAQIEIERGQTPPVPAEQTATPEPPEPPADSDPEPPQAAPPAAPLAARNTSGSYIGDLAAVGYSGLSVDQLIAFKIHGVTPEYVRGIQSGGFKPTPDQLVQMRIHGVTPEFANQVRSAGYPNATIDELVSLRIHGAPPNYPRLVKELGLGDPSIEQLISMLIHGVSPDFAREIKATGLRGLNFDRLIAMRIHGVGPVDVREAQKHFKDLSIDQMIKLKQLGILSTSNTI